MQTPLYDFSISKDMTVCIGTFARIWNFSAYCHKYSLPPLQLGLISNLIQPFPSSFRVACLWRAKTSNHGHVFRSSIRIISYLTLVFRKIVALRSRRNLCVKSPKADETFVALCSDAAFAKVSVNR